MSAFPRVYGSFAEFEREELKRLDSMTTVSDLVEERFSEELDFGGGGGEGSAPRRRGRPRKNPA